MADHEEDNFIREIDEDLRQEKHAKLWKQYGNYVIGAAVALVLSVAAVKGWQGYSLKTRLADSATLTQAISLIDAGKTNEAIDILKILSTEGTDGYALLARLRHAASLAVSGDTAGALAAYDVIAADTGIDAVYRDLAVVLGALLNLDAADPTVLSERVAPLTADDNPWRYSAREITAHLYLRKGDKAQARDLFVKLSDDAKAPAGIRDRAASMRALIGG